MKKISFYTLGCKLNQAETAVLAEQFEQGGYQLVPFGEPVDICVINTCTVTSKSDYRCRQMIRKAKKISPSAAIAVVGCYAQLSPEKISSIDGVDYILGSDKKFELPNILDEKNNRDQPLFLPSTNDSFLNPGPGDFWNHTRAFLKIQDGCDSFCTYCTVPLARGRSRSDSLDHIRQLAEQLVHRGHLEIVLTGVHIGRYGRDLNPSKNLLDVLIGLEKIPGLQRIRLSSLEPREVDDALLQFIAQSEKVCHHFHIPLQSGDDEILSRMKRNYDVNAFREVIDRVKEQVPNCGLGTDIIVGFPGETDEQFHNTMQLVEDLPFTYLHVFSYSPRSGTRAARFADRVFPPEIKSRSELLRALGRAKKQNFLSSLVEKKLRVLWEEKQQGKWMFGFADNYARVRTEADEKLMNTISQVEIVSTGQDFVLGKVVIKI